MNVFESLVERGFINHVSNDTAVPMVLNNKQIIFYAGFDPSADSLHVGSLSLIMLMAHLERAGHTPMILIGGGTALIGDPSGKTEDRQMLDEEAIHANADAISEQIGRFFTEPIETVNNAEWIADKGYIEFLREVGSHFRVNEMIKAEGYRQRLERESGLSFLEFSYQLIQGYDFLHLHREHGCRLQVGGSDQWGNIAAGISLTRRVDGAEVYGFTIPLLTTANGKKMGKTESGTVWISAERTSPYDFYQYWINVADADVGRFLRIYTFLPIDEIVELEQKHGAEIREAKNRLAFEVTRLTHGEEEAKKARDAAKHLFADGAEDAVESVPTKEIKRQKLEEGVDIKELFVIADLAESKSEARRFISDGGAAVNDAVVHDPTKVINSNFLKDDILLLRRGKKRYVRLKAV